MRQEFGVSNRNGDSWRFQPKMKEAPSNEVGFSRSSDTPIEKAPGVGYLEGMGISNRSMECWSARTL